MSNEDHNNQEYHSGKSGSRGNDKPYPRAYPYQPVEYPYEEEDEIDLKELATHFWGDRKLIAKITGAFVIIGLIIALFSAVEYETGAVLMPEFQNTQSTGERLLDQFGGLFGIGGGASTRGGQNIIYPVFYPKIVESVPYMAQLMQAPITFAEYDTTTSAYSYFTEIHSPSLLSYIKQYTIGLPGVILGLFSSDQPAEMQSDLQITERDTVLNMTREQWIVINTLRSRVNVQVDERSGLVTLTAEMPDPMAAAELTKAGIRLLTDYVKEYHSRKAVQNLEFVQEQVRTARQEFEAAQQKLAEFRDSNLSLASARAQTREQELQSAYNLAFNTFNSLRQQLQAARMQVQAQTPVVSILQPVTVPETSSEPKRKLIVIVSLILGLIVAVGWSLIRGPGREVIREIRAGEAVEEGGKTAAKEEVHN